MVSGRTPSLASTDRVRISAHVCFAASSSPHMLIAFVPTSHSSKDKMCSCVLGSRSSRMRLSS
eukprot:9490935-Pyramimonas_sp.AAC.1